MARSLTICLRHNLNQYFVNASSKGSGECAHAQTHLNCCCLTMQCNVNLEILMRILFLANSIKDIFATLKFCD